MLRPVTGEEEVMSKKGEQLDPRLRHSGTGGVTEDVAIGKQSMRLPQRTSGECFEYPI
jgi:hypothetical protein